MKDRRTPSTMVAGMIVSLVLGASLQMDAASPNSPPLFQETFADGPAGLKERGWTISALPEQSLWEIKNNALSITCFFKAYNGGSIAHDLPPMERGELTFEANLNSGGVAGYDHLSLQVNLGNLATAFTRNRGHEWRRNYNNQWQRLAAAVPDAKWTPFRLRFDNARKTVEYYCNDLQNPSHVDTDVVVGPADREKTLMLRLGNYGLAHGTLVHQVRNIRLTELATGPATSAASTTIHVYRGLGCEQLRTSEILAELGQSPVVMFDLITNLTLTPKNRFTPNRVPSPLSPDRPAMIVWADVPVGPGGTIPAGLLEKIERDVRDGTHLLVLGGLFSINKGQWAKTPLEKLLPVELGDQWELGKLDRAEKLTSDDPRLATLLAISDQPLVPYCLPLAVKPTAKVLLRAGTRPVLITATHGKGTVTVCLASSCGDADPGQTNLWSWPAWPKTLVKASQLKDTQP